MKECQSVRDGEILSGSLSGFGSTTSVKEARMSPARAWSLVRVLRVAELGLGMIVVRDGIRIPMTPNVESAVQAVNTLGNAGSA